MEEQPPLKFDKNVSLTSYTEEGLYKIYSTIKMLEKAKKDIEKEFERRSNENLLKKVEKKKLRTQRFWNTDKDIPDKYYEKSLMRLTEATRKYGTEDLEQYTNKRDITTWNIK